MTTTTATVSAQSLIPSVTDRHLSSLPFPFAEETRDEDEILETYAAYLRFVSVVGNQVDSRASRLLNKKFQYLKSRDPQSAAQFLKLLRFEMEQYLQLKGGSRRQYSSNSSVIKKWVKKYIRNWYREVDEAVFRYKALALTRVER